jgi:hypothetical protein
MSYCPHHVKSGECPICEAPERPPHVPTTVTLLKVFAVASAFVVGIVSAALTNWWAGLFFSGAYLFVIWRVILRVLG